MSFSKLSKQTDDWLLGKRNRIIKPQSGGGSFRFYNHSSSGKKPLKQGFGLKNLTSAARKLPEVMVKIPKRHGASNGLKGIQNNLDYISRNGDLDLEDQDGNKISGKSDINRKIEEYRLSGIPQQGKRREALNIVLSMPPGSDPVALKDAVRAFAKEEFEHHRWVMVQHLDTSHPHCHLNVLIEDDYGRRLNPRKQDLFEWRLRFAEKLREQGVECTATRRQHRGKYQKTEDGVIRHIQDRGGKSWVLAQQAHQLAQAIATQNRPTSPFIKKQLETQKIIVEEYGKLAHELYRLGYKQEAKLIAVLRKEVENGDMRSEMQMKYDKAMENSKPLSGSLTISHGADNRQPETPNNDKNSDIER